MNKTELAEILALSEKANLPYKFTPGDWDCERECGHKCGDPPCNKEEECEHMQQTVPADITKIFTVDCGDFMGLGDDTAAYIAAACNNYPALARQHMELLDKVERLEKAAQTVINNAKVFVSRGYNGLQVDCYEIDADAMRKLKQALAEGGGE